MIGRWFRRKRPCIHDIDANPVNKMLVLLLTEAVHVDAEMLCFGIPHEDPRPVPDECPSDPLRDPPLLEHLEKQTPGHTAELERSDRLISQSTYLRYRNGYNHMIVRYLVDGEFYEAMPIALNIYPSLLEAFGNLLLSLNASQDNPQPRRYIEIFTDGPERKFAEVQMIIEQDNTIRIELLGVRTEPVSVIASPDFHGSQPLLPRGSLK